MSGYATSKVIDRRGVVREDVEPPTLTEAQRRYVRESLMWSQQVEGVSVSKEVADRAIDRALREPLPTIR